MFKPKKAAPKGQPALEVPQSKKIAIVGTASTSVNDAPWKDESWQIWSLGRNCVSCPRFDRWFELHTKDVLIAAAALEGRMDFLKAAGNKLVIGHPWEELPEATLYPWVDVITEFGRYLTSSLSEMVALAMQEGATEIGLWGVDMVCPDEYCVAPETKVLTEDLRWVPVSDISVGDALIGFDEHPIPKSFRHYRKAVVEKADVLTRPCYRLYMEDGTEMVCSAEHRWLTYSENDKRWRRTDELVTSRHRKDRPSRIVKLFNPWQENKSWDAGYLAAAVDGEGHLDQTRQGQNSGLRVGYSQKDNPMSEEVHRSAAALGYSFGNGCKDKTGCAKYILNGGRAKTFEFLGSIRPRRLLGKFDANKLGVMHQANSVAVVRAEFIGEQTVIGLKTSTATFIAEGFASHNSQQRASCEYLLGRATERGIKVTIAKESPILRPTRIYGLEDAGFSREIIERKAEAVAQLRELESTLRRVQEDVITVRSTIAVLSDLETRWG